MIHKPLGIAFLAITYLVEGIIAIPAVIASEASYHTVALKEGLQMLGNVGLLTAFMILLFAVIIIPFILSYGLWKGRKWAWFLTIVFVLFQMLLLLTVFGLANIMINTGSLISSSVFSLVSYIVAYSIAITSTYAVVIIILVGDVMLVYYLTREKTKAYFF